MLNETITHTGGGMLSNSTVMVLTIAACVLITLAFIAFIVKIVR